MSTYVCSDIHGRYDRYAKLLREISFSDNDEMFILGDVIDRSPNGIEIILDILDRTNVHLFIGNHEKFLLDAVIGNSKDGLVVDDHWFDVWTFHNNGGIETFNKFKGLDSDVRDRVLSTLRNCLLIKVIDVSGKKFHLSHSSTIEGFVDGELSYSYVDNETASSIVWNSVFRYDKHADDFDRYSRDLTYIVGHVPVQKTSFNWEILKFENIIDIDCGCGHPTLIGNSLSCLRLEDMKEFYVY